MKTLLIPTDFKLQSLNCIPLLARQFYPQKLNVLLVHTLSITDSVSELVMLSRRSAEYRHISNAFYFACNEIKQSHTESINELRVEFFYGNTVAVFKKYLEENNVDAIVSLEDYDYELLTDKSFDPLVLISRSGKEILPVAATLPPVGGANDLAQTPEAHKL